MLRTFFSSISSHIEKKIFTPFFGDTYRFKRSQISAPIIVDKYTKKKLILFIGLFYPLMVSSVIVMAFFYGRVAYILFPFWIVIYYLGTNIILKNMQQSSRQWAQNSFLRSSFSLKKVLNRVMIGIIFSVLIWIAIYSWGEVLRLSLIKYFQSQ